MAQQNPFDNPLIFRNIIEKADSASKIALSSVNRLGYDCSRKARENLQSENTELKKWFETTINDIYVAAMYNSSSDIKKIGVAVNLENNVFFAPLIFLSGSAKSCFIDVDEDGAPKNIDEVHTTPEIFLHLLTYVHEKLAMLQSKGDDYKAAYNKVDEAMNNVTKSGGGKYIKTKINTYWS